MLFENLREELTFYDGAFRAIMIVKPMSDDFCLVFQNALDSISYILKNQNNWLDDQYVSMGFQNIENAKDLLMYLVDEGNLSEEQCLINARATIGKTKGLHPMSDTLLTREQRDRLEQLKSYAREAITKHNDSKIRKAQMSGPIRPKVHGASPRKNPTMVTNQQELQKKRTIGWKSSVLDGSATEAQNDKEDERRDVHTRQMDRGHGRGR